MDIQQIASQLVNYLGKNPQLIQQFIEHPYSTTAKATGAKQNYSSKDMSQIVTAAAALSNNQKLGMGDVANIAAALMGQNNNSVHSLTNMLFGGGNTVQPTQAAQQQSASGSVNLGSLVSMATLAATLMSSANAAKKRKEQEAAAQAAAQQLAAQQAAQQLAAQQAAQSSKPTVNLNDGLDLGEIAALASQFLGGGATTATVQQQPAVTLPQQQVSVPQAQPQASQGIDFATLAQLASVLLAQK